MSNSTLSLLPKLSPTSFNLLSSVLPGRVNLNVWFISYTLLIFDYFITLETEINEVWTCQWSPGLLLFYFNRYLPVLDFIIFLRPVLAGPLSVKECKFNFPTGAWLGTLGLIISQTVIILRTYAIWGRRRLILWVLTPITIILFGTMLGITAWKTHHDQTRQHSLSLPEDETLPDYLKCTLLAITVDKHDRICLLSFYMIVCVGEAAVVVLTINKANQHISNFSPRWVSQLYKNGIIFCVCILGLSLFNAIVVFSAPVSFQLIFIPAQRILHSIFANRVMLLIFQNRKRDVPGTVGDRRGQTTFSESAMAVFTSVHPSDLDIDETSWHTRARLEWVQ